MTQPMPHASTRHTNADAAELDRFNRLAARWWDETSEFRPLHRINPHRLQWIDSLVGLRDRQVLDVGCGGGILAESMARRGATVTGIDLAEWPLRIATQHAAGSGLALHYAHSSAEDWCTRHAQSYELVTCMEMLEHVPRPAAVVEACAGLVRPGGWVFFSTLNRNALSYLVAILGAEHLLRILPRGTHQYRRFIKPFELEAMAARQALVLRDRKGLRYNPFTQRFRLAGGDWVGYLLAFQRAVPASEALIQT